MPGPYQVIIVLKGVFTLCGLNLEMLGHYRRIGGSIYVMETTTRRCRVANIGRRNYVRHEANTLGVPDVTVMSDDERTSCRFESHKQG